MEEHGRDSECDDKRQPHAFGAKTGREGQIYSEGQGDTYIGEEGDTHGDAYILYAAQHSGTDALQSVGKLEERA